MLGSRCETGIPGSIAEEDETEDSGDGGRGKEIEKGVVGGPGKEEKKKRKKKKKRKIRRRNTIATPRITTGVSVA